MKRVIGVFLFLLLVVGVVSAEGMTHDASEICITVNGVSINLQEAINDNYFHSVVDWPNSGSCSGAHVADNVLIKNKNDNVMTLQQAAQFGRIETGNSLDISGKNIWHESADEIILTSGDTLREAIVSGKTDSCSGDAGDSCNEGNGVCAGTGKRNCAGACVEVSYPDKNAGACDTTLECPDFFYELNEQTEMCDSIFSFGIGSSRNPEEINDYCHQGDCCVEDIGSPCGDEGGVIGCDGLCGECIPGNTEVVACSGVNTVCKDCSECSRTCRDSGTWGSSYCSTFEPLPRGETVEEGDKKTCDGKGNYVGWSGPGCSSCPTETLTSTTGTTFCRTRKPAGLPIPTNPVWSGYYGKTDQSSYGYTRNDYYEGDVVCSVRECSGALWWKECWTEGVDWYIYPQEGDPGSYP